MPDSATDFHVTELHSSPADQINSLRLASDGNTLSLAGMTASPDGMHDVSIRAFETDTPGIPRPLAKLTSPFGTPFWDVAATPKGFATVWTMPGSAISSLGYQVQGQAEITLTGHYPSGVFQNPRFVRGNPGLAVTACALQPDGEALVLFPDGPEKGDAPYRLLPAAGEGTVLDGLLIRIGDGYLLLAKYAAPTAGAPHRADFRGESVAGGILRCLWLAADFQAVGSAYSPFGDSAIYEFDADASDGRIYLAATKPQGYFAAAAIIRDGKWNWIHPAAAAQDEAALFAPALYAQGKSAAMAFLVGGPGSRNVLRGRISIQGN